MEAINNLPNLTFDTSCVISLLGQDSSPRDEYLALIQLMQLHENKKVRIWISEKSRTEAEEQLAEGKRERLWLATLETLNKFPVTQGGFIIGVSKLGIDTTLVPDEKAPLYNMVKKLSGLKKVSEKKVRGGIFDSAILLDHILQGNEFFVSRDKFHLGLASTINNFEESKTVICNPTESLSLLKNKYNIS